MIYFTKYANKKFDILNKYNIFITKEEVEEAIKLPDKTINKGKYLCIEKAGIQVITKKDDNINKIITFYPKK